MESIWQWGLDLIRAVQHLGNPFLDNLFRAITFLGEEEFYLLLLPVLLWCLDWQLGQRVAVFFLLSSYLNAGLKDLFEHPRPYDLEPALGLASAEGYGLPSGHAQLAVALWGGLALGVRKAWFWIAAVGLMGLIGFSRVYLGVHFPTDVLAGWAIGALSLFIYQAVHFRIERWIGGLKLGVQILLAVALPIALLLLHPVKDTVAVMSALVGAGAGLALTHRYLPFDPRGTWWQRALRFLTGGIVAIALYLGLRAILPGEGAMLYLPFRALRYGLVGLWMTLGAPWLFVRLRLATLMRTKE